MDVPIKMFLNTLDTLRAEAPTYRTGGTGSDGTCDCVGMIMGALIRAGIPSKTFDLHSSNYYARYRLADCIDLTSASDCFVGMIVTKYNTNQPDLNDRYKQGGSYYNGDIRNHYHIGVVISVNPLRIQHCTTITGKVDGITIDTSLGKWKMGGCSIDVDYNTTIEEVTTMQSVIVTASSGSTVRLRAGMNTNADVRCTVPVGASVDVTSQAGDWSSVTYNGVSGYMMTKFLHADESAAETDASPVTRAEFDVLVARVAALEGHG